MRYVRIIVRNQFGEYTSKLYDLYNMHDMAIVNTIRTQTYVSKSMEFVLDDGSVAVFSEEILKGSMVTIKDQKQL